MLWTRGRSKFSHGSGTSTERVKMTNLLQLFSLLFMLQADSLNRTLSNLTQEHTVKSYTIFGESSHFLNVGLCVSPQYDMLDMRKNQDHTTFKGASFS